MRKLPTQARLHELLLYDPATGVLRWTDRCRSHLRGEVAGRVNDHGYTQISIDGVTYRAARVIWVWMTGIDPAPMQIDHEDRVRDNDRWSNLRLGTPTSQAYNRGYSRRRSDLPKGVGQRPNGRFYAYIGDRYLGLHDSLAEAHAARLAAEAALSHAGLN